MKPEELIESYIDNVVLRLPRKLRNDVGLDLRAQLEDQLETTATAVDRAPDQEMTISMLRDFGRPTHVADRYHPRGLTIIEPEHGALFLKLAAVCIALQWTLTLPLLLLGRMTSDAWWLICFWGALWWPGVLVGYFGAATWVRRQWPIDPQTLARPGAHWLFWLPDIEDDWRPMARRVQVGGMGLAIVGALVTILFIFPVFLDRITPSDAGGSWARYDADFQRWLLVPLIALIAARLSLYVLAVVNARLRSRTEWIRVVLWFGFVGALFWALIDWDIFVSDLTDIAFKLWLSVFLLINCLQIAGWMRRFGARVGIPIRYSP